MGGNHLLGGILYGYRISIVFLDLIRRIEQNPYHNIIMEQYSYNNGNTK